MERGEIKSHFGIAELDVMALAVIWATPPFTGDDTRSSLWRRLAQTHSTRLDQLPGPPAWRPPRPTAGVQGPSTGAQFRHPDGLWERWTLPATTGLTGAAASPNTLR